MIIGIHYFKTFFHPSPNTLCGVFAGFDFTMTTERVSAVGGLCSLLFISDFPIATNLDRFPYLPQLYEILLTIISYISGDKY